MARLNLPQKTQHSVLQLLILMRMHQSESYPLERRRIGPVQSVDARDASQVIWAQNTTCSGILAGKGRDSGPSSRKLSRSSSCRSSVNFCLGVSCAWIHIVASVSFSLDLCGNQLDSTLSDQLGVTVRVRWCHRKRVPFRQPHRSFQFILHAQFGQGRRVIFLRDSTGAEWIRFRPWPKPGQRAVQPHPSGIEVLVLAHGFTSLSSRSL